MKLNQHSKQGGQKTQEKCGFMILTPTPLHNGGLWCAENYPCKNHGAWKVNPQQQESWNIKLAKMYCECEEGEESSYQTHRASCPLIQGKFTDFQKEQKIKIKQSQESVLLKSKKAELVEEEKELQETLSNHLVSYYSMTNSSVVDTDSGEQIQMTIKATISAKQLALF